MAGANRLVAYDQARATLLERIISALRADERVIAAWLSGSIGRGDGDLWADYDLHVAIDDEGLSSFLADRGSLYASAGEAVLVQDRIPGHTDAGERFNLVHFASPVGPIEVDWSFIPAGEARKPPFHFLLFEKRLFPVQLPAPLTQAEREAEARVWSLFFWAMAPIAVRLCGRGDLLRAMEQTRLLSRALICLWRLLDEEAAPHPWMPDANRPLESEIDARLPRLGTTATLPGALDLVERLCAEAESLQTPLAELGADVAPGVIGQTRELVLTAREAMARGASATRKYR